MQREASGASSPGTASPTKKSRSPKKATFNFSLRKILRLNRPRDRDRTKRLRDGVSPIHTQKRTERSMSESMVRVNLMQAFEEDDEEKRHASDGEAPVGNVEAGQEQAATITRERAVSECDDEEATVARPLSDEIVEPALRESNIEQCSADAEDLKETSSEAQGDKKTVNQNGQDFDCAGDDEDQSNYCEEVINEEQDQAQNTAKPVARIEREGTQEAYKPMSPIVLAQTVLGELDRINKMNVPDSDEDSSDNLTDIILENDAQPRVLLGEAPSDDPCPINDAVDDSETHQEISRDPSKLLLTLYRIDEESNSDDENSMGDELQHVEELIGINSQLGDSIPPTATHHIRVGILPGSPIHASVRLMSIFEEDEVKSDDDDCSDHEISASVRDGRNYAMPAVGIVEGENLFMLSHEDNASEEPDGEAFDSSSTADNTPTSPVELEPHAADWLASRDPDSHEDGGSTWTNCSSYDGDGGTSPSFTTAGVGSDTDEDTHRNSVLNGDELVMELEQAEGRLNAAIIGVSDVIDLASEALGFVVDSENRQAESTQEAGSFLENHSDDEAMDGSSDSDSIGSASGIESRLWSDDESWSDSRIEPAEHIYADDTLATAIASPATTTHTMGDQSSPEIRAADSASRSDMLPSNKEFAHDSKREGIRTTTTHLSPFGVIYGEDSGDRSGISTSSSKCILNAQLAQPSNGNAEFAVDVEASGYQHDSLDGSVGEGEAANPSMQTKCDFQKGNWSRNLGALTWWPVAIACAVLLGKTLVELQPSELSHCDEHFHPNLSSCQEIWDAIAEGTIEKPTLPLTDPTATVTTHKYESTSPGLIETDVIAACEFVIDTYTEEDLAAAQCAFRSVPDDLTAEFQNVVWSISDTVNDFDEARFGMDQSPLTPDVRLARYLLGLAFTLLIVAFLQYGSRLS